MEGGEGCYEGGVGVDGIIGVFPDIDTLTGRAILPNAERSTPQFRVQSTDRYKQFCRPLCDHYLSITGTFKSEYEDDFSKHF